MLREKKRAVRKEIERWWIFKSLFPGENQNIDVPGSEYHIPRMVSVPRGSLYPGNSLLSDLVPDFQVEEMTIHKMINVPRNLSSQFTSQFQDRGSLFLGNNLESDLVPGPGNNNSQNYNCSQKFKFGINHPKIPRQGSLLFSIIFFCRVKQINHWRHSVVACKLYFSHLNQLWLLIVNTYSRRSDLVSGKL